MITHVTASTAPSAACETTPLVSYIMNLAVTNFTANALLAAGAAPAMTNIVGEAGPFASTASVLLINLGTPIPEQYEATRQAVRAAHNAGVPWALDPVAVGAFVHRTAFAHELPDSKPTVIRGNTSGIIALAGTGIGGCGVDAANEVDVALDAARALVQKAECMVATSGAADAIVPASEILHVGSGAEMLTRVTGGDYALGVVSAAFVSAGRTKSLGDPESVAACHIAYSAATERAESQTVGSGTFAPFPLDALHSLEGAGLERIPLL